MIGWTTETEYLDGQRIDRTMFEDILKGDSRVLIFGDEQMPTACVHVERKSTTGYIGMLTVNPYKQGKGIGSYVLAEAENFIKQKFECNTIHMWAGTINLRSIKANKVNFLLQKEGL